VRIYDCDSFQIASNGRHWLCEVGVDTHQPPEMQILPNYKTAIRAANHDFFGLAVLIFQMLCIARHPFSGTFVGRGEASSISDAIKSFDMPTLVTDNEREWDRRSEVCRSKPWRYKYRNSLNARVFSSGEQGRRSACFHADPIFRAFAEYAVHAVLDYRCATLPLPPSLQGAPHTFTFRFSP
jgi:hypothetical protein